MGLFQHGGAPMWPLMSSNYILSWSSLGKSGHPQTRASQQSWEVRGTGPNVPILRMEILRGKQFVQSQL